MKPLRESVTSPAPGAPCPARGGACGTVLGGTRTVHVRRVTLLLAGETAPRHARVRAAAAAAAANSGPIGTNMGYVRGEGFSFPRPPPINGLCNSRLCRPRLRPLR
jgi:hypothetical protein